MRLVSGIKRDIKNDVKSAKNMRLPWWGVLCVIIGCVPICWLLDSLGRLDLARPALCSLGMIGVAIAMKWKLRRRGWFWIAMTVIVALHVLLILSVSWTTKWVPAMAIVPIGIADLYLMLAIVSLVGRLVEPTAETSEK